MSCIPQINDHVGKECDGRDFDIVVVPRKLADERVRASAKRHNPLIHTSPFPQE
jgi:hypothetical protein